MGKRVRAGKQNKLCGTRNTETICTRTVKRNELDIIGSICGTTRNHVGKVFQETSDYNESKHDDLTECIERERTNSSSCSTATAVSDDRDSDSNHRL